MASFQIFLKKSSSKSSSLSMQIVCEPRWKVDRNVPSVYFASLLQQHSAKKKTISVTEESQEKPSSFIIPWSDSVTRRSFFSPGKKKKSLHLCSVSSASNGIHCSSVICVFFMLITHKSCLREAEEGRTGLGGVGGFSGRQPPGSFVTADE